MSAVFTVLKQSINVPSHFLIGSLVTLLLICSLISRWRNRKLNAFMDSIPGPIPIPFIGTIYVLIGLTRNSVVEFLLDHAKQYPKVARHWFTGDPYLVTGDIEIINAILASQQNINKTPPYRFFKDGCNGLFSSSGDEWKSTRRALTPGFKTNIPGASFADNYSYHLPIFMEVLKKYADDGKEHDLFPDVHLCLCDLVFDNMFDTRWDLQRKNHHHIIKIVERACQMMYERLFNPLIWPDWVYALLGKKKTLAGIVDEGRSFMREVLNQRMESRNQLKEVEPAAAERPQTYMEVLLSNVESGVVTYEHALEELVEMAVAGTITSAIATSTTFMLLSMFPDIQERAYQEVIETCTGDEVTLDDLPKLVYIEMIVKETLRHYTIPFTGRQLVEDLKINDKMTIPAGVNVKLGLWILHHNPEFWEKPFEFYPEHFSKSNEMKRPRGAFVPFASGPRICPGNRYAMQSMKIMLATTLLHYELSSNREPPQDIREDKYRILFLLRPTKQNSMIQIKRRQSKNSLACFG